MPDSRRVADAIRERGLLFLAAAAPDPCRDDPGQWATEKLGYTNAGVHDEWYGLLVAVRSLVVIAPRDSAKSQCLTINNVAWRCAYSPGFEAVVFAATDDVAKKLKARIDDTIAIATPALIDRCPTKNEHETVLNNGAKITAAGAGKAVRSAHPDLLVGDDVLDEEGCRSHSGRERVNSWWYGTVEGMRHSGQTPRRWQGRTYTYGPTLSVLCGTPFHQDDLLMAAKQNAMVTWRRYASEFQDSDRLPGSWAIEANDIERDAA